MDYWDPAGAGIRAMYNAPPYSLEFALIADGVPKDKLYPLDVPRAFKSFEPHQAAVKCGGAVSQPGVLLQSGEITMTRGPLHHPGLRGQPMGVSYDGAALTYEAWVVPTGAPNRKTR